MAADHLVTVRDISALTENAQRACRLFLQECKRHGLKVLITETYRSQERQNYLYSQGRTREGKIVTWTRTSRHTSRRAWDICKNSKGEEYSDRGFFDKCGEIANGLGISWGGEWKTPDMPHFEVDDNWRFEGDEEMNQEERAKFNRVVEIVEDLQGAVDKLNNKMIYNYIDENMPDWAVPTIEKLVSKGVLMGDEKGLHLNEEMLRVLVVLDRTGAFDK